MALTKDFRETIRERAQREPRFRKALLREAIELMLSGDEKTGRAILRYYIDATVGFRRLEEATSIPANSHVRMFGPNGNPSAKNLFGILAHLQAQEGVNFELRPAEVGPRWKYLVAWADKFLNRKAALAQVTAPGSVPSPSNEPVARTDQNSMLADAQ
jgi:hypothetical protein